jgi:hypothetical protein
MPKKSGIFFTFWDVGVDLFKDVEVCPLSRFSGLPLKPLTLFGLYDTRDRRIYLDDIRDVRAFFHEASHHVITQRMPHLYDTPRGRAVEEAVADIAAAAAAKMVSVPRGAGWLLIEMGLRLKPCRMLKFDEDGDPYLASKCILTALKAKPKLILSLFP